MHDGRHRQHIAIVGGGYAGILALGRLRMALPEARLTLVDPGTHFRARIHAHRVASGGRAPDIPYPQLVERWGAEHLQQRLTHIEGRRLTLEDQQLEPDGVLLCLGSRTRPAPGPAYTLDAPEPLWRAVQDRPDARVTVIGAGTTALELATALARVLHARGGQVTIWRAQRGWGLAPEGWSAIDRRLAQLGVRVVDGGRVSTLTDAEARSATHREPHDVAVWCAGFVPVRVPGLPEPRPDGRISVDACLRPQGSDEDGVFAAGDLACPPIAHRMGCVTALPTGAHAADNLARWLTDRPLLPFRFTDVLTCVDLGGMHGLVEQYAEDGSVRRAIGGVAGGLTKAGILAYVRAMLAGERWLGRPLYSWPQPAEALLEEPA